VNELGEALVSCPCPEFIVHISPPSTLPSGSTVISVRSRRARTELILDKSWRHDALPRPLPRRRAWQQRAAMRESSVAVPNREPSAVFIAPS